MPLCSLAIASEMGASLRRREMASLNGNPPMLDIYDPRYLEGVRLFNEREFFECHDVLEDLWSDTLGEDREFYQGLIHAAVALFHFETGNFGGARKMYLSACRYLEPNRPRHLGMNLEDFLSALRHCFQELLDAGSVYPADAALDVERIPMIRIE